MTILLIKKSRYEINHGSCCDILFIYGEDMVLSKYRRVMIQWNLSVTTTSMIKFITCDLFSNVF